MSEYAGRHRDALTGSSVAAAANRRRQRILLLAAVAVAVVVAGLFAVPVLLPTGGEPGPAAPTVPPEAGLQLLGRQGDLGDLAERRQEVGTLTPTTTPDGQPTDSATATTSPTSPADETSPAALAASPSGASGSTSSTTGTTRTAPRTPTGSSSTTPGSTTSSATESNPRSVAKTLFPSFGFADSEFGCLNAMWNRLDRWGSVAQVRPGLAYVKSRYGTPCAAWDHVRETGQY